MHYPLCHGEEPAPDDASGRPGEVRFYAICKVKTNGAPVQRVTRMLVTDVI